MNLQDNIIRRYISFKRLSGHNLRVTYKEIAADTDIPHQRVRYIFRGSEMKITEYERFLDAIDKLIHEVLIDTN